MPVTVLERRRLERAKAAFATRRVDYARVRTLLTGDIRPHSGDIVLARVDEIGKQARLELASGRRAVMFPGDEILVAYGNRYAPDQYEAIVGLDLAPCDLVAAGGVAAIEIARHRRMIHPTRITPIGLAADAEGRRLNLMDFRAEASDALPRIPAVLSLGTSMNAGKSLAAASMVRGFRRLGHRVAALKITGTGSGGDLWIVGDAGAEMAADFTDAGFPSTYLVAIPDLERAAWRLMNLAAETGCDIAVIEIADGLQQLETAALIRSAAIRRVTLGTLFSAYDSMGAMSGVATLREAGHDLAGLSGRIGLSPLGVREAEAATGLRYFSPWHLQEGALVPLLRERAAEKLWAAPDGMTDALRRLAGPLAPLGGAPASRQRRGSAAGLPDGAAASVRQVLHLVAGFIVEADLRRYLPADGEVTAPGGAPSRRVQHRIWSSGLGMIHVLVPRLAQGTYRPRFLGQVLAPELVLSVIEGLGQPQGDGALRRLVVMLGGAEFERADLHPLRAGIAEICERNGLAPQVEEERPSLTIDRLDLFETEDEAGDDAFGLVAGGEGGYGHTVLSERGWREPGWREPGWDIRAEGGDESTDDAPHPLLPGGAYAVQGG